MAGTANANTNMLMQQEVIALLVWYSDNILISPDIQTACKHYLS